MKCHVLESSTAGLTDAGLTDAVSLSLYGQQGVAFHWDFYSTNGHDSHGQCS